MEGEAIPDALDPVLAESAVILEPVSAGPPRPWGPWATIGWTLLCLAAMLAAQTVVLIAFLVVRVASNPQAKLEDISSNGNLIAVAGLMSTPPVLGLVALLIVVRRNRIRDYLALTWPSPRPVLLASVGMILLLATSDLIAYLVGHPIVPPFVEDVYRTASLPLLLAALLIAAPLGEEVLMRGFLYRGIADSRWGVSAAIVISSALWAVIHVQYGPYDIGSIFLMGIYLGVVRWRTGSVLLTILLHTIANTLATVEVVIQTHTMP